MFDWELRTCVICILLTIRTENRIFFEKIEIARLKLFLDLQTIKND